MTMTDEELIGELLVTFEALTSAVARDSQPEWNELTLREDSGQVESMRPVGLAAPHRKRVRLGALVTVAAVVVLVAFSLTLIGKSAPPSTQPSSWRVLSSIAQTDVPFAATGTAPPTSANQSANGLTCPSVSTCYATVTTETAEPVNGPLFKAFTGQAAAPGQTVTIPETSTVFVSKDGGKSWTQLNLPSGVSLNTQLSCPTEDVCFAGAQTGSPNGVYPAQQQVILETTDAGSDWRETPVRIAPVTGVDPNLDASIASLKGFFTQLDCFSADSCLAVGLVPSDQPIAGQTPSEQSQAEPFGEATVMRTVAMTTTDAGKTWSTYVFPWSSQFDGQPGVSNAQPLTVSCPDQRDCVGTMAVDNDLSGGTATSIFATLMWSTGDGGQTWSSFWPASEAQLEKSTPYPSLTCADSLHCIDTVTYRSSAATYNLIGEIRTSDGGEHWSFDPALGTSEVEIRQPVCPSANECWVPGGTMNGQIVTPGQALIIATTDGGASWSQVPIPAGMTLIEAMSCPAPTTCFALGGTQTSVSGPLSHVEILSDAPSTPS